jgi:DNA-binding GntR family transcriptional regulator
MPSHTHVAATDRSADTAYDRLRQIIVRGMLAPGTRIVEIEIAQRLGVSRTPAREALQRLQQEGYIVAAQGGQGRPSVAPLTERDARELFAIVGELEGLAARGAAELDGPVRSSVTRTLHETNQEFLRASRLERPDPSKLFELDTRFHHTCVQAGAGPRLRALHDAIKPQAERYVRLYISALTQQIATSVAEHQVIIDAIEAGDRAGAQLAVRGNWRNANQRLARVIQSVGERGSW